MIEEIDATIHQHDYAKEDFFHYIGRISDSTVKVLLISKSDTKTYI